jgi:pSer/pThr/pTyr-binding forkhead associated (FHA) protein
MGYQFLVIIPGIPPSHWSHAIAAGAQTVGRSPRCPVQISHPTVSALHVELRQDRGIVSVRDLGSRNGTFVNNSRVTESGVEVHRGDVLRLGSVHLEIIDGTDPSLPDTERIEPATNGTDRAANSKQDVDSQYPLEDPKLTSAQRRVLKLALKGLGEKQMADQLFLSQHTVHCHLKTIYKALGVHSRGELISLCLVGVGH